MWHRRPQSGDTHDSITQTTLGRGGAEISGEDPAGHGALDELVDEGLGVGDVQGEVIRRLQSSCESEIRLLLRQDLLGDQDIVELRHVDSFLLCAVKREGDPSLHDLMEEVRRVQLQDASTAAS
jgi:hypothetical protein